MKTARSLALVVAVAIAAASFAQIDPKRDFVACGKFAYMMLPPQFVCGPLVKDIAWAPDGQHVAVLREFIDIAPSDMSALLLGEGDPNQVEPESQILVWSNVTQKTTTWLKFRHPRANYVAMQWMTGSSSLILQGTLAEPVDGNPPKASITILSANGKTIEVRQYDEESVFEVNPSPFKPIAIIVEHSPNVVSAAPPGVDTATPIQQTRPLAKIRFFGTDAVVSDPITLPSPICIPFWSKDGRLYIISFVKQPGDKKNTKLWYVIDRATLKTQLTTPPADARTFMGDAEQPELWIKDLTARVADAKLGIKAPTVLIMQAQAKDGEESVVSTDGSRGEVSPKLNGVSYESQGSLMVRPMVKVSLEAYKKARESAIKARIISQAKQVALGMIMYANDYDDVLMSNKGNWQTQLDPYLKDPSLYDGFIYSFAGGNMTAIENPSETVLGYIDGPGGRAVAYTDGHVKWIPNP